MARPGRSEMETTEALKRRIGTVQDVQSIVRTMKVLAAVSIRNYEKAVAALAGYSRTIEMGMQIVLRRRGSGGPIAKPAPRTHIGAIVFGSDQGMCGPLNDQIVAYSTDTLHRSGVPQENRRLLVVGQRAAAQLEDAGQQVEDTIPVPGSAASITPVGQEVVWRIEQWQGQHGINAVLLFHNRLVSSSACEPHVVDLLPLDLAWLRRLQEKAWPSHVIPMFTMDRDDLLSWLIRQYLFVSLYRAFAESLASEHASRLAAMQAAERNIEERLRELTNDFHQQRQMAITTELLDIVAGFEAMTAPPPGSPRRL